MPKRKKKEGVYQRPDSDVWWCTYPDASGQRIRRFTGTTNKREAMNLKNKLVTDEWNKQVRGIEPDRSFDQSRPALLARYKRDKAELCN